MRILWSSNAIWAKTGYGNQTALIIPRLFALGHQVGLFAWWGLQGGALNSALEHNGKTYDLPMYPMSADKYGNDVVAAHATKAFSADIIITLIDAWVLDAAKHSPAGVRWCPYFPIDMHPIPPPVLARVKDSFQPIVYSRFGERMAREAGLDPRYVPHMIDTSAFAPGDRIAARDALGWPKDAFIVGMVAANKGFPSRKSLPEQIRAFAKVAAKHPDMRLYLHTARGGEHEYGDLNLPELCALEGISDKVLFPDSYALFMGYPDDYMVNVYRGLDVLSSVSMGEGFGIPIVEAQACGCPVIVGDWTSMSELCFGGWKVPKPGKYIADYGWIEQWFYTPLAADQYTPLVADIIEAYEQAYTWAHEPTIKNAARAGALQYDADLVAEQYWKPVLAEIEQRMHGASELESRMDGLVKVAA